MKLEEIIAQDIPASMLERVVFDQDVIGKIHREMLFKPSGASRLETARAVVEGYGSHVSRLAWGLYEQVRNTDWSTAERLFEHFRSRAGEFYNHQASLVGRIPTLDMEGLAEFLAAIRGQVCLILSRRGAEGVVRGTGFLVGPDLVLTCRHVLGQFADDADISQDGNRVEIYFDFRRGEQVDCLNPHLPEARKVGLAKEWRVASCAAAIPDGILGDLTAEQASQIGSSLDFILVRLSEKVGLQPMERGGGRQRRWVDVSTAALPRSVENEDWIIIPQHPDGFPQRIDLGRFRTADVTDTRLRYDTNTAPGSSGAPCFNQKFLWVGLHNAHVPPGARPLLNQAIRGTLIAPILQPHVAAGVSATGYVLRWSIARDSAPPRVVLGREKLLDWLRPVATGRPRTLADRVYAALTDFPNAGCTFSVDVLEAEIRDSRSPRAVYGKRGQLLPDTVEDFLTSLLRELGITLTSEETIPKRPLPPSGDPSATNVDEIDKVTRWISTQLPEWLGRTISSHVEKKIDARESARKAVEELTKSGIEIPAGLKATAESKVAVFVCPNAWDCAYVVMDDLRSNNYSGAGTRTELKGEVRDLIAALVLGKTDVTMISGLSRLRWMFLGYLPDFIPPAGTGADGATMETLEPDKVGIDEILGIFDRMSDAYLPVRGDSRWRRVAAKGVLRNVEKNAADPRLMAMQREVSDTAADFLEEVQ